SKFELRGDDYLGLKPGRVGLECWSMGSSHYVKNAVQVVKDMLKGEGRGLIGKRNKNRHASPLHVEYKPELDVTPECDDEHASRFRQIIGIRRWSVEIGQTASTAGGVRPGVNRQVTSHRQRRGRLAVILRGHQGRGPAENAGAIKAVRGSKPRLWYVFAVQITPISYAS
ncbi:hypothetical protein THAOC_12244, partial [Thalassiosira oceanica]